MVEMHDCQFSFRSPEIVQFPKKALIFFSWSSCKVVGMLNFCHPRREVSLLATKVPLVKTQLLNVFLTSICQLLEDFKKYL